MPINESSDGNDLVETIHRLLVGVTTFDPKGRAKVAATLVARAVAIDLSMTDVPGTYLIANNKIVARFEECEWPGLKRSTETVYPRDSLPVEFPGVISTPGTILRRGICSQLGNLEPNYWTKAEPQTITLIGVNTAEGTRDSFVAHYAWVSAIQWDRRFPNLIDSLVLVVGEYRSIQCTDLRGMLRDLAPRL